MRTIGVVGLAALAACSPRAGDDGGNAQAVARVMGRCGVVRDDYRFVAPATVVLSETASASGAEDCVREALQGVGFDATLSVRSFDEPASENQA